VAARKHIGRLLAERPELRGVDAIYIDEGVESELADSYDYYYVPTFYVNEVKHHEGAISYEEVREVFEAAYYESAGRQE
jgi:hypothetical protein